MDEQKIHGASLAAVENAEPVASAAAPHVAKHTPGVWYVNGRSDRGDTVFDVCSQDDWIAEVATESDARLIAAAKEMLSALKMIAPLWDRGLSDAIKQFVLHVHERDSFDECGAVVKAAILKAEGKV